MDITFRNRIPQDPDWKERDFSTKYYRVFSHEGHWVVYPVFKTIKGVHKLLPAAEGLMVTPNYKEFTLYVPDPSYIMWVANTELRGVLANIHSAVEKDREINIKNLEWVELE